jgi:hypothetical protein
MYGIISAQIIITAFHGILAAVHVAWRMCRAISTSVRVARTAFCTVPDSDTARLIPSITYYMFASSTKVGGENTIIQVRLSTQTKLPRFTPRHNTGS